MSPLPATLPSLWSFLSEMGHWSIYYWHQCPATTNIGWMDGWMDGSHGMLELSLKHMTSSSLILLEKAMAPHSPTLAWKIPWVEEPGRLQSMRSLRVGHDWATSPSLSCIGEGSGNPLQCSCLENPRDGEAISVYKIRSPLLSQWILTQSVLRI